MKIIGEKSLASFVKLLLDMIFIGGMIILITLPKGLEWYLGRMYYEIGHRTAMFLLGLLYITGALALLIVNEIRKIFSTLKRRNPFMMDNVKSLKYMGIYSFLIAFFYVFKMFFLNSFLTVIIVMIFIIAGFFSIVLGEVFSQAVRAKEENDFTI